MSMTPEQANSIVAAASDIRKRLKPCQETMLQGILSNDWFTYVIKCARRLGKSYLLCTLAVMVCLLKPSAQVRYAAPTAKALRKIVRPIMGKILRTCPKELRPTWVASEGMYRFPNGSEIHLAGVNGGHADDLRGTECDLFLIDEARDIDDLHYLVHDVALPQFLDADGNVVKGRRLVVASSPAANKAHEFSIMAEEAKLRGSYAHYDIFAGGYSAETIRMFFREDGLPEEDVQALIEGRHADIRSTTVKREYLALDVIDEELAVVPEWSSRFVVEREPTLVDHFYHRYIFMDIGVQRDFTVLLFAFYDFLGGYLYVEDEVVIRGPSVTTPLIARGIFERTGFPKEITDEAKTLVFKTGLLLPPNPPRAEYADCYRRISDNSHPLLLNDLSATYSVSFTPTSKDKLHEMVNSLRVWVKSGKLRVHPRCKHTIGALESAVWNRLRTEFDHSRIYGHYDAVAAMVYGTRGTDVQTNPIPAMLGVDRYNVLILPQPKRLSAAAQAFADTFGLPRR